MSTINKDLGMVTAYAYAVAGGYQGTEEEFEQLLGSASIILDNFENFSVTVETLPAGSAATASYADGVLSLGIPKGDKGDQGDQGETGATGATPDLSIGTVTTLNAGDDATATIGGTAEEPIMNLGIPKGPSGNTGVTAELFSASKAYSAGDFVIYNDALYTFTADHAAGAWTGSDATQTTAGSEISQLKEDLSDKTDWVVGSSEQLLSDNYTEDSFPYLFRASGGNGADREYDEVVGGSIAWNQLAPNELQGYANEHINKTVSGDEITVTSNTDTVYLKGVTRGASSGRVYLASTYLKSDGTTGVSLGFRKSGAFINIVPGSTAWQTNTVYMQYQVMAKVTESGVTFGIFLKNDTLTNGYGVFKDVQLFDLTAMFGSTIADYIYSLEQANAGAGVAFFRKLFPKPYYEYNAGELKSVEGVSEHVTVGFNQWDEEWEVGGYAGANGQPWNTTDRIRSKTTNYISILPNTVYYSQCSNIVNLFYYDANKNYLGTDAVSANSTFTTPSGAYFLRFFVGTSYGTTYKNDICINLSWSGYRNGEYEPYVKHSYPFDDTLTLRGIPKLDGANNLYYDGDTYADDGTVTRKYGVVDLSTLTWNTSYTGTTNKMMRADMGTVTYQGIPKSSFGGISAKYPIIDGVAGAAALQNVDSKSVGIYWYSNSSYPTARDIYLVLPVNETPSGEYVVKLATPTTEEAEPYTNPQILSGYGTEEYVSTGIVPVGHNTKYPENLKAKIEGLPWNFATLIAPTESTYTATRNYTTGQLLIVNNILYKATANIANGGTITPNTNVTATTLAEVISAL